MDLQKKTWVQIVFLFAFCLCLVAPASGRDAGWVKAPQSPDPNLLNSLQKNRQPGKKKAQAPAKNSVTRQVKQAPGETVYDGQPLIREDEVRSFLVLLPRFRIWARQNGEEAHPVLTTDGKPDFQYSQKAAQWVGQHNFEAPRFFCIMGKMAAGLVIVEEGNDFKGTRPADMPAVAAAELELVRKHLGELLSVTANPQPMR